MFQVRINGEVADGSKRYEEVESVHVVCVMGLVVDKNIAKSIVNYVYDACMKCTGVIMYNGIIIPKNEIKQPTFN